jgi:hypothetical protein
MVSFRPRVRSIAPFRGIREKASPVALFRSLSALAFVLILSVSSAQATSSVDGAITSFQTEGLRLIGLISTVGIAIIGAGVLMMLGWAMLRKVSGAK